MKLSERNKKALGRLLQHMHRPPRVTLVSGLGSDRHLVLSRLARNIGPVQVITTCSAAPTIHTRYAQSLGSENNGVTYHVSPAAGPHASAAPFTPAVSIIDARADELSRCLSVALQHDAPILIWDYAPEEPSPISRLNL